MTLRKIACHAALITGLAFGLGAPVRAATCDDADCPAATKASKPSKPLQLGRFMQSTAAKPPGRAAKSHQHAAGKAAVKRSAKASHRNAVSFPPPAQPMPDEAAAAFAAQPAPDVHVVESDEINEIDRAAGPAWPETTGLGSTPASENAVLVVAAGDYNDIDRKSVAQLVSTEPPATVADEPARSDQTRLPSQFWVERFWAMIQHTFVAIAAGWRYLFG